MIVIGLTGGIGMGKSTVARQLQTLGVKVSSADVIVHRLLAEDNAVIKAIDAGFPGTVAKGKVDRKKLGAVVFHDSQKRQLLERILHPRVMAEERLFVQRQRALGTELVAMDIPLLFETGGEDRCDVTLLATAPFTIQKQRVMKRPGMTEEKFHSIVKAQMPDDEKRLRADRIVHTGLGKAYSFRTLASFIGELCAK